VNTTLKATVFILATLIILTGCEQTRRSSDSHHNAPPNDTPRPGFIDDSGTRRLDPPTILEQQEGKTPSTKDRATGGAKSARPGNNWLYDTASKEGFFLVAASSAPLYKGGDMIRRIDLAGKISEFDYDQTNDGKQGAFIYIPDEMRPAIPTHNVDAAGLFSGRICGFVPGPNKTIFALAGSVEGGVAFLLDPYEKAQAFTPLQAISLPRATRPCRAVYSDTLKKLYVVDVTQTEAKNGQEGIYVADIYGDNRTTTASFYVFGVKHKINSHSINNFQGLDLYNDTLYLLSGNARFDAEWEAVVYQVPLNTAGEPLFDSLSYTRTHNPIMRVQGCGMSSWNIGAIAAIDTADGPILLTTGTNTTIAWDMSSSELKKIDLNPNMPGIQGFNLEKNGRGGLKFNYAPKGDLIFQLPHCRSEKNKIKIAGTTDMLAFNIMSFTTKNFKPADVYDAGYRELLLSLKGAAYFPQFSMTFADFSVGTKHIAVLGASESNISGLSAGGDVIIIDRQKKTPIAFDRPKDMRRAHEIRYGFKLAQGDAQFEGAEQNSRAVIWIP